MSKTTDIKYRELVLRTYIYLMYTARGINRFSNKLWLTKNHLNLAKFIVLKSTSVHGGKITSSHLASLSVTERSNITALVKSMQKEKLIETEIDPTDKRVKYIKNTIKGQKLLEEALLTESQIADSVMRGITQNQLMELYKFIDKMQANVNPHKRNIKCLSKKSPE